MPVLLVLLVLIATLGLFLGGIISGWIERRVLAGAAAASLWALGSTLTLISAAPSIGWTLSFAENGPGAVAAVGVGSALIYGALPALSVRQVSALPRTAVLLLASLVIATPPSEAVAALASPWAIHALVIGVVAVPAQLFADWTVSRRRLAARNAMHAACYTLLLAWCAPWLLLGCPEGSMSAWSTEAPWLRSLVTQLFCLPGVLGMAALTEYTQRGGGSPMPLDPPVRLVTTGPFAYVANPLQLAKVLTLVVWALYARSAILLGAAVALALLGAVTTEPAEHSALGERFGDSWRRYRASVRAWLPHARPRRQASAAPAALSLRGPCGPCMGLARWFQQHEPVGLRIATVVGPQGQPLPEIVYRDGPLRETGVVALARALDHVNLGWALFGWCVRLPGIRWGAQVIYEASTSPGAGVRSVEDPAPGRTAARLAHSPARRR